MKDAVRCFVTDCEGPISKNDNAFELTCHFVPDGEKLFTQISRYDDIQAEVVRRKGYKAGDTLKLVVPFLVAHGATDRKVEEFCERHVLLMPGARDALRFIQAVMPSFIVSTSYVHYIRTLCRVLEFPLKNTFSTSLKFDAPKVGKAELKRLRELGQEICGMPPLEIRAGMSSWHDLHEKEQHTLERLDEIFLEEFKRLGLAETLKEINPVGGIEKVNAVETIIEDLNIGWDGVMFVGDSITDVECLHQIRQNGGVALSFNGNVFAVREAEIALLSPDALILSALAEAFKQSGKRSLINLVDAWSPESLRAANVSPGLLSRLQTRFPAKLPRFCRVTGEILQELEVESSTFRKLIRGEKVGRLG